MPRIVMVLVVLAVGALALGALIEDPETRAIRRQAEAERVALQVEQARRMAEVDHALGVAWRLLAFSAVCGVVGLAGRWGWLALDRYEHERMPRRGDGLLPVRQHALDAEAAAALEGHRAAARIAAQHPPAPGIAAPHLVIAGDHDRVAVRSLLARHGLEKYGGL